MVPIRKFLLGSESIRHGPDLNREASRNGIAEPNIDSCTSGESAKGSANLSWEAKKCPAEVGGASVRSQVRSVNRTGCEGVCTACVDVVEQADAHREGLEFPEPEVMHRRGTGFDQSADGTRGLLYELRPCHGSGTASGHENVAKRAIDGRHHDALLQAVSCGQQQGHATLSDGLVNAAEFRELSKVHDCRDDFEAASGHEDAETAAASFKGRRHCQRLETWAGSCCAHELRGAMHDGAVACRKPFGHSLPRDGHRLKRREAGEMDGELEVRQVGDGEGGAERVHG